MLIGQARSHGVKLVIGWIETKIFLLSIIFYRFSAFNAQKNAFIRQF